MKKLILIILAAFICTITKAQLANTNWIAYDLSNTQGFYWSIGTDTIKFSENDTTYYVSSTYVVSGNIFYIIDQNSACPDDTGIYFFTIQNDTLAFTLISDICTNRSDYFTQNYFVNSITGLLTVNPLQFSLSPNPSDGNFTITFPITINKATIDVTNTMGAKLYSQNLSNTNVANIQLKNFKKGIYIVKINDGIKNTSKIITVN